MSKEKEKNYCECDQPIYPGTYIFPEDVCEWCGKKLKEPTSGAV